MTKPNGFIPTGTGPKGERFGRDATTGLAFKADGTTRKRRATLTTAQKMAALRASASKAMSSIGRSVLRTLTTFAAFRSNVGTFRKWVRDCVAYSTPERCAERRAFHERALAAIDAKHAAAVAWLPKAAAAVAVVDGVYSKVGSAVADLNAKHGREPTSDEVSEMVGTLLSPEVRSIVEGAANPENDPFGAFRRNAADVDPTMAEDLSDEDGDDADDEDPDADED